MCGKQKMIVAAILSMVVAVAMTVMPTRASAQDWRNGWGDHDGWRGGPGWHGGGPPPWSHGHAWGERGREGWGGGPGWQNNQWGGGDRDGDDGNGYGNQYGNGYGWNNGPYDNAPYNYGAYNGNYGNGYNPYYGQSPAMNAIGSLAGPLLGLPIP